MCIIEAVTAAQNASADQYAAAGGVAMEVRWYRIINFVIHLYNIIIIITVVIINNIIIIIIIIIVVLLTMCIIQALSSIRTVTALNVQPLFIKK
jgi:hypothetical protein